MCASAAIASSAEENGDAEGGEPASSAVALPSSITDPFLRHLLSGADARTIKEVADGCKQLEKDQTEVEQILVARASSTKQLLALLLRHVGHVPILQQQGEGANKQQAARLQAQINRHVAQNRTLAAQLQAADNRWLEAQEQIKKLQNELADAEQELSNVQRKLFTMKSSSDLAVKEAVAQAAAQPAMPGPGPAAASTPGGVPSSTPGPPAPAVPEDLADELQELQHLLQKRTSELDRERELHTKTNRCAWLWGRAGFGACSAPSQSHTLLPMHVMGSRAVRHVSCSGVLQCIQWCAWAANTAACLPAA